MDSRPKLAPSAPPLRRLSWHPNLALRSVNTVPVNYAIRFGGPVTALTARRVRYVSSQTYITVVNSVTALLSLLNNLTTLPIDPPSLYLDLEGIKLGRHGSISTISLYESTSAPRRRSIL
jgi:hypothetical protein